MKSKLIITLCLLVTVAPLNAQTVMTRRSAARTANQSNTDNITLGKLIARLTENISSSALTPAFVKNEKGWLEKANMVTQMTALSWFVQNLHDNIKPSAFGPGWASVSGQWVSASYNIQTVKDAAALINTLSDNIDPSLFSADWIQQKPSFKASLDSVTQ